MRDLVILSTMDQRFVDLMFFSEKNGKIQSQCHLRGILDPPLNAGNNMINQK